MMILGDGNSLDIVTQFITAISIIIGALIVKWQINAKRKDDQCAAQLARLDKQLSNLYGPLYALFEAGDIEFRQFCAVYRNIKDPNFLGFFPCNHNVPEFPPPTAEQLRVFRTWMNTVFMPTNEQMADIMVNNAELLVGDKMPPSFLQFCVHVASLKANLAEWQEPDFDKGDWKQHIAIFGHPAGELHDYIKAGFESLKLAQSEILSGKRVEVNDRELSTEIQRRIAAIGAAKRQAVSR